MERRDFVFIVFDPVIIKWRRTCIQGMEISHLESLRPNPPPGGLIHFHGLMVFFFSLGIYSTCTKERREAILSNYWRRYIPTCNLDGTFTAVQCWKAVQVCWCVDLEGEEKFETRSINRKPICSRKDSVLAGKMSFRLLCSSENAYCKTGLKKYFSSW